MKKNQIKIPSIWVGCGNFSIQRLEALSKGNLFVPVACVDINIKKAKSKLSSIKRNIPENLCDRVYTGIAEAKEKYDAKACFIFVSSKEHPKLIIESLKLGMHTYCVKPIANNQKDFKKIMDVHKSIPELMLLQGFNNQWNEAAIKMREWLQSDKGIGKMLGGECVCWGRQNITANPPQIDATDEGMYVFSMACHQLSQLVAAKGLPDYVTAYVHSRKDIRLDFRGVWGTSGIQCLLEYPGGVPFSYTGTRAAHGNPFGFASRWSGQWTFHGDNGDIRREGGRLTLYRDGVSIQDNYLKDLDTNLIEDEQIQFKAFYDAFTTGKNRKWLQQSAFDTWILMEACNESARKNEKVSVQKLKKYLWE